MSRKQKFTDEELWELATKHKQAMTSVSEWNRYAKTQGLPHSQTMIQRFGSWNEIKEKLELEVNHQYRPQKYDRDELLAILKEHKTAYTNIYAWNQYAIKHKLPTHQVFEKYLGLETLELLTELKPVLSKESVKRQIKEYFPERPPTVMQWLNLSKQSSVVSTSTIIRYFGSWNNMKAHVYR